MTTPPLGQHDEPASAPTPDPAAAASSLATAPSGATGSGSSRGGRGRMPRRGRGRAWLAGLGVLALVGGGIAAADPLGWRTTDPHRGLDQMVPSDTIAYLELDSDPGMTQQVEMVAFALKVPSLRQGLGLTPGGDLKQQLWHELARRRDCTSVDFAHQVEPWLGARVAVALRHGASQPVVVLEADGAPEQVLPGARAAARCLGWAQPGVVQRGGTVVLASSQALAEDDVADAIADPLADRAHYAEDMPRLGSRGVATLWLDREGMGRLQARARTYAGQRQGLARAALDEFSSARLRSGGATLRFVDGTPQLRIAAKSLDPRKTTIHHTRIEGLPANTSLAMGLADGSTLVGDHWQWLARAAARHGQGVAHVEQRTHFRLPGDLKTVLGKDLRVAVGPVPSASGSWSGLSWAGVGTTDRAGAAAVLARTRASGRGWRASDGREQGDVVVSRSRPWARQLAEPGATLAEQPEFMAAYPRPEQAQVGVYANLQDLEPLLARGLTGRRLGDYRSLQAVGLTGHEEDADYSVLVAAATAR